MTVNEANALPLKKFRDKFAPKTREERKAAVIAAVKKTMAKEDINELSKGKLSQYIAKAAVNREKHGFEHDDASDKHFRSRRPDKITQDHDYGETDSDFADRKARLGRNRDKWQKTMKNSSAMHDRRSKGIHMAARKILKGDSGPQDRVRMRKMVKIKAHEAVNEAHTEQQLKNAINHHWDNELKHHSKSIHHLTRSIEHLKNNDWKKENFHNLKADGHDRVARRHAQAQDAARSLLSRMRMRKMHEAPAPVPTAASNPMTYHAEGVEYPDGENVHKRRAANAAAIKSMKGLGSRNEEVDEGYRSSKGQLKNGFKTVKYKMSGLDRYAATKDGVQVGDKSDFKDGRKAKRVANRLARFDREGRKANTKDDPLGRWHGRNESVEVNEISAGKLGKYVLKSKKDEENRRSEGIKWRDRIRKETGLNVGTPIDRKLYSPTASREAGRKRAIAKLTGNAKVHATEEVSASLRTGVADRLTKTITGKKGISTPTASGSPKNNPVKLDITSSAYAASKRPPAGDDSGAEDLTTGAYRANRTMESVVNEISKGKVQKYLERAQRDHGMASVAARHANDKDKAYFVRKEKNLRKGISRGYDRLEK